MVTGQKIIQTTNSLTTHTNKALSIQISLSGLSFCILNRQSHVITYFKQVDFDKKITPFETLERLKTVLESETELNQPFASVLAIYQNELSNLVPQSLFDENNAADYLKFSSKILKTDFISHDAIATNNSVNVYVPYVNINNYLFDTFGEFEYKHTSTIFIDSCLQKEKASNDAKLYINVETHHFELVALNKGTLLLYNTFEYATKEDFIYFVLFTIEQLKLNPETVILKLSGKIEKEDDLYTVTYKYIRFVEFDKPFQKYKYTDQTQPKKEHHNIIILNSFI